MRAEHDQHHDPGFVTADCHVDSRAVCLHCTQQQSVSFTETTLVGSERLPRPCMQFDVWTFNNIGLLVSECTPGKWQRPIKFDVLELLCVGCAQILCVAGNGTRMSSISEACAGLSVRCRQTVLIKDTLRTLQHVTFAEAPALLCRPPQCCRCTDPR